MRYAHQGGMNPPVIVVHGSALDDVPASHVRYLERSFLEGRSNCRARRCGYNSSLPTHNPLQTGFKEPTSTSERSADTCCDAANRSITP